MRRGRGTRRRRERRERRPEKSGPEMHVAPHTVAWGATDDCCGYSAASIIFTRSLLGLAPATDCTGCPPLNTVSVGTDITW